MLCFIMINLTREARLSGIDVFPDLRTKKLLSSQHCPHNTLIAIFDKW